MENLFLKGTDSTPEVFFNTNGDLLLEGRSMPEDVSVIYNQLFHFVQKLEVQELKLKINLDYFNTASSKKIMELLQHIEANQKIKTINVEWHYEEGDDDSVETAEIYEDFLLRTNFRYFEYEEALAA